MTLKPMSAVLGGSPSQDRSGARPTMIAADVLSVPAVQTRLNTRTVGAQIHLFDAVDSTNDVACRLAREGAPEGTVVLADAQTSGRGRLGQPWFSPPGVNLHVSVILRPKLHTREAGLYGFISSLALTDALKDLGLSPAIKWPNDVLVDGKKVAGSRAECVTHGDEIAHVVLGVGVNVNVELPALREALGPAGGFATSLRAALGREVNRNELAAAYLSRLDTWARRYRDEGAAPILAAWRDRDVITGRRVEARGSAGAIEGRAVGMNALGHLVIDETGGHRHVVAGGEIRILE